MVVSARTLASVEVAQSGVEPQEKEIDLDKVDQNGVSEDIIKDVKELETIDKEEKASGLKEPGERSKAKRKRFLKRIPLSPKTREIQARMGILQQKLAESKSDAEAQGIMQQIHDAELEMMADPNYVKAKKSLRKLAEPKELQNNAPSPQSNLPSSASPSPSNNSKVQVTPLMATPSLFFGFMGNLMNSAPTPNMNQEQQVIKLAQKISVGQMQRGDVMLLNAADGLWTRFVYAMFYGHAGNYDGGNFVYESNPGEGVRLKSITPWLAKGNYLAVGRDRIKTAQQVQSALTAIKNKYGTDGRTKYNYAVNDKYTDTSIYCSQLPWKVHNSIGVDLDSNDPGYINYVGLVYGVIGAETAYVGVAPDEIDKSSNLNVYAGGWQ